MYSPFQQILSDVDSIRKIEIYRLSSSSIVRSGERHTGAILSHKTHTHPNKISFIKIENEIEIVWMLHMNWAPNHSSLNATTAMHACAVVRMFSVRNGNCTCGKCGERTENNATQTKLFAGDHPKTILITWSLIKRFKRIRKHKNNFTNIKMRNVWRMHLKQSANFQSSRINSNSSKSQLMNENSFQIVVGLHFPCERCRKRKSNWYFPLSQAPLEIVQTGMRFVESISFVNFWLHQLSRCTVIGLCIK